MIINAAHDFGFVHIPKCAGSTVRQQLREQDDLGGRFYHTMTLPDIGRINGNHVPLDLLESHFPEDLARLRAVTSYAIVRAPADRFVSSIAQYLRTHVGEPAELTRQRILDETAKIIDQIRADPAQREIRNTIFFRQADFVCLRGERIIDHVYAMEDMDAFFDRLETVHGLQLDRETVWNPTVTYRVPGSSGGLKRIKTLSRRVLPTRAYAAVRDLGVRLLTTKGVPKLDAALEAMPAVRDFVAEHYAADAALYRSARHERTAAPAHTAQEHG